MRTNINLFFLLNFIIALNITANAQNLTYNKNIKFNHIGLEQGLSQSTIYSIVQDSQGFMWFATQGGLNRYDGYSMTVFKHKLNDSNSISDNAISCLITDNDSNLWIGTFKGGLDKYDISKNKFFHHIHDEMDSTSISNDRINFLFKDSKGNIWAGTSDGLDLYNKQENSFIHYNYKNNYDVSKIKSVNAICEDQKNNLWIGSSEGIFNINLKELEAGSYFNKLKLKSGKPFVGKVISIYADSLGLLWIGTEDTVLQCYDIKNQSIQYYTNSVKGARPITATSNKELFLGSLYVPGLKALNIQNRSVNQLSSMHNDLVNAIYMDRSGIVWIGTFFHGVYIYDKRTNQFVNYLNSTRNNDVIMAIMEDHKGSLWIGTFGNGIKHLNTARDNITTITSNPKNHNSITSNTIMAFAETPNNVIWIGTIGGGLDKYNLKTKKFENFRVRSNFNKNGISSNNITSLYKDHKGDLWIGQYNGSIDIYNNSSGTFSKLIPEPKDSISLSGSTITEFYEDSNGEMWIGTHGNGLLNYSTVNHSFKKIKIKHYQGNKDESMLVKGVSSFYIDDNKNIWIGSDVDGLIKYNQTKDTSIFYDLKNDLKSNTIYGILPDSKSNLWLSTNNGIIRFNTKTSKFKNFDKYDGLQSNEFNQGAYFRSKNGELFFGGVNGFNAFFPDLIQKNNYRPPVYITTFKVFDKVISLAESINWAKEIQLSYFQNFFSFEFVALNYTVPEKNKYAYKLEGFDKTWHTVTAQQRYASYTNLDPGKYLLRVKGSNNDGLWNNKGTSLTIIITPPFWMTWWFKVIIAVFLITIAQIIYTKRVRKLKKEKELQHEISQRLIEKQEEERSRIAQEMHDSIGQDMLFIKNRALLTMQNTDYDNKIYEQLSQISETSSKALKTVRQISHNLRPPELDRLGLTETIRTLLLQTRESTNIKVNGQVEEIDGLIERDMEINIVRIMQESLGNIIKHSKAKEIDVSIQIRNGKIFIEIADDGIGFDAEILKSKTKKSFGMGLTGINERVKILGGNFNLNSSTGQGTGIEISIPIKRIIKDQSI